MSKELSGYTSVIHTNIYYLRLFFTHHSLSLPLVKWFACLFMLFHPFDSYWLWVFFLYVFILLNFLLSPAHVLIFASFNSFPL